MVGTMSRRPVSVAIAVVARQQLFQRVDEIVVRARAGLDYRHTRRGVRHEDVAQPVSMAAAERAHRVGEVDDLSARRVDIEHIGIHETQPTDHPFANRNMPIFVSEYR